MKEVMDQLSRYRIIRIHRSYLVNYYQVEKIERNNGKIMAVLNSGLELPVSQMYFNDIIKLRDHYNSKSDSAVNKTVVALSV